MATSDREDIKGDFACKAGGFGAFVETIDKGNKAAQVLTYILSNQLMLMISKIQPVVRDFYKARGYDPDEILKTDEEIAQTMDLLNQLGAMGGGAVPPEEEPPSPESPGTGEY